MGTIGDIHIKVSTEVLNAKADAVLKNVMVMSDCFDELKNIVNRTSYYWIGEAGEQHRLIYNNQQEDIDEMLNRLKEHPRDLLAISQNYSRVEKAILEETSNLPGDIIE